MHVKMTGDGVPRHRESHYQQAKHELEDLLRDLAAADEVRLPAEDQLASALGFSRPTVRSALLALQSEGKIERRHGVGTFVNRHALRVQVNLAEDRAFLDIIDSLGFEASCDIVSLAPRPLHDEVAVRGGAAPGASGVVIDRLFRASGTPAVLSRDAIPLDHLTAPVDEVDAERSTFAFVRRWLGRRVRYSVTTIRALAAPDSVAAALGLPPGSPTLMLDHQHIDDHDEPVGVTQAYINGTVIEFSVIRASGEL